MTLPVVFSQGELVQIDLSPKKPQPKPAWLKAKARAQGILPGVAGICLMLVVTILNAFAALQGKFGAGSARSGVPAICTLFAAGMLVFLYRVRTEVREQLR